METPNSTRRRYILEIAFIMVCLLGFTSSLWNPSPKMQIQGREFTYLVNSGTVAAEVFDRTGAIPLWNPLIGHGEPLIENPFSFVLNPLMTLPIFALGAIQGAKLAAVLHILLMGLGGWTLAHTLQLRLPGRLLLGLLLGGSGSMAAAIGTGFYQLGLSQSYVPWVYAGLIGTLHSEHRRYIGLLAAATMLFIFAGTFWYVLPTALSCGVISLWYFIGSGSKSGLRLKTFLRLMWAGLLILGLSAVRLLPQIIHHDYIVHPAVDFRFRQDDFFTMASLLFRIDPPNHLAFTPVFYHYILPPGFALLVMLIWLMRRKFRRFQHPDRSNILVPAIVLLLTFIIWSQEGIPLVRWFYHQIPLLAEWRFLGRMLAAASPWLAVIIVVLFDDLVTTLWNSKRIVRLCALGFTLIGAASAVDVLNNWRRVADTVPDSSYTRPPLTYLHSQQPSEFISVLTWNYFSDYLPFYETLSRAAFGNPDYHPGALPSTIGTEKQMQFYPEYAIPGDDADREFVITHGYAVDLSYRFPNVLYQNINAPPYAFLIDPAEFEKNRESPITHSQTTPVSYLHRVDSIIVPLQTIHPSSVLVIQETAYPGWTVQINGKSAPLESVGGLLGVRLMDHIVSTQVIFSYQPLWYYRSAAVSLITIGIFIFYLVRVDTHIRNALKRSCLKLL